MEEWIRSTKAISMTAMISTSVVAVVGLFSLTVSQIPDTEGSVDIKVDKVLREVEIDLMIRQPTHPKEINTTPLEHEENNLQVFKSPTQKGCRTSS